MAESNSTGYILICPGTDGAWAVWRMHEDHPSADLWMQHPPQLVDVERGLEFRWTTEAKYTECRACLSGKCRQRVETSPNSKTMIVHSFLTSRST